MKYVLALAALASLGGCISLLPEPPPPPRLFVLEAGEVAQANGAPLDVVVGVAQPQGERAVLGPDLVWRENGHLAFVAQSQWPGRAQDSLQALVVETMARQGRVRAAVRAGDARSQYDIRWDVLDFEVVQDAGRMTARFAADVKVLNAITREVVGSTFITAEQPVSDRSSSVAADALARAAEEGGARIGLFAAEAIERAETQASAASINR